VSTLAPDLERLLREAQADRLPSVSAAVAQRGQPVWAGAVGLADAEEERAATPDTQYRVGSITKTFTAVALMQLVERGEADLDDPLERHLPETRTASTLRRMLSHLSGLQREPEGEMWETLVAPTADELVAQLARTEPLLPPHVGHHYSNVAFGVLGLVVARHAELPYRRVVEDRILRPLALDRTTWEPAGAFAHGYSVDPYADVVRREAQLDLGGAEAAGQLWSTTGDLCRWATFLAEGHADVLRAETIDAMWFPQALFDPETWTLGWGLGLMLYRDGDRVFAGHGGAMPGHLAGVVVDRRSKVAAAALTNAGSRADPERLALRLAQATIAARPDPPQEWRPQPGPPPELESALGRWWAEGTELLFLWEDGRLVSRAPAAKRPVQPSVFEPLGDDRFRTASGREQGELLRLVRDEAGTVVRMYWATYPLTRAPELFGPPAA
jgi:CubicO group peptidase (beta-lactamase class C family)